VDRVWLEQNGATLAAEARDETLTSAAATQVWTLTVRQLAAMPVTLRLAVGSSNAAGSSGTITLVRTGGLPQALPNPICWDTWAAAHNATTTDIFEFLQDSSGAISPLTLEHGSQLNFRFAPNRTGVVLGLESSPDLANWQPDTTAGFLSETVDADGFFTRTYHIPAPGSTRFFRLSATPVP
jgi:hypothetical protein